MKINLFPEKKNTQVYGFVLLKSCVDKFSYIKKRAHLKLLIKGQILCLSFTERNKYIFQG